MAKFLQYRDGGKSDEKGISTHLYGLFQGEVINGLAVSQGSPLGMTVNVSKGRCMIDSGDDYPYLGFTDANEVVTITAADGSNPRIDAIVAYVDLSVVDSTNSNNPGAFEIVAVAGTPAGSPNPPDDSAVSTAIGLGNPFIRLAHVTVGAGVTTITTGNVSDQRVFVGLPDGFIRSSNTLAQGVVTAEKIGLITQTYTPVLRGSISNPNIGSTGSITGRYTSIGKWIQGEVLISISGSGINSGNGSYYVDLPTPVDGSFHTPSGGTAGVGSTVGSGYFRDDSHANLSLLLSSAIESLTGGAGGAGQVLLHIDGGRIFASTQGIGSGDRVTINFAYMSA